MSSCRGTGNHSTSPRTKPPPDCCGAGRPVTIEPQQDAFRKLIKNYKNISGEFYYENVAVGGTDGIVKMFTIRYARGYLSITDGGVASIFYNHVYLHAEKHIRKRKLQIPPED